MDLIIDDAVICEPNQPHAHGLGDLAPSCDWHNMGASDHFVQFYESDESLVSSVSGFVGAGIEAGEACIVIATPAHRAAIDARLGAMGIEVEAARERGQLVSMDAAETLSRFMFRGAPHAGCFMESVGGVVARAAERGKPVRAFGEMVALLWTGGNHVAAIQLEQLWNELAKSVSFCLFCGYSMDGFDCQAHDLPFAEICSHHSRVIPAESYASLESHDGRLREVSALQQKARALEAEIVRRKGIEKELVRRERELADFFENAIEGLHKVGPDGVILWANQAELRLLGYSADEYVGHHISSFHADPAVIDDMLGRLLRGETLYDYPARLLCKDGSIKHVLVHSNACFDEDKFLHSRCFTRDVTEQVRMEVALREHVREIEDLNARLKRSVTETHHRVKNNLQLMSALIEMQKQTERDMVPMAELVRLGQNIQALGVIHDILTMQSREDEQAGTISILKVLERLLPTLEGTLAGRHIQSSLADVMLPGKHTTALALISNELISNAVKHGKGDVELSLRLSGDRVTLEVCDDGPGFPPGFNPDFAANTGIELIESITRHDLGGSVSYQNRREGGARVSVKFPMPTAL